MDKDTIENILIASNMIKTLGSLYYTNYHGECNNKLGTFVNFVKLPKTICFGIDDNEVYRLFFFTCDVKELNDTFSFFPVGAVIEYTGLTENPDIDFDSISCIEQIDSFKRYKTNLSNFGFKEKLDNSFYKRFVNNCGEICSLSDFDEMKLLLGKIFDKRVSHLPNDEELGELIKNDNVFVVKNDEQIKTFWIFKKEGKRIYSYQAYNSIQGTYLQSMWFRLFEEFKDAGFRECYAWVSDKNFFSLNLHYKFNFIFDRLYLKIYQIKNMEK